jgi:hypothetical protein
MIRAVRFMIRPIRPGFTCMRNNPQISELRLVKSHPKSCASRNDSLKMTIEKQSRHSGVVELPISWIDNDHRDYGETANGALPSPEAMFQTYKAELIRLSGEDPVYPCPTSTPPLGADRELCRLDRLITFMKSKPGV